MVYSCMERSGTRRMLGRMWTSSFRVKSPRYHVTHEDTEDAPLQSLWELVNVGLHGGLLIGCLVVAGQVGGHVTGPSGVLSVAVAVITVSLSGICYAEFRARWPRVNGSPYEYTYLSTGEGVAFIIAWMSLLQDISMAAAAGRAASQNLDFLLDNLILNRTMESVGCLPVVDSCPDPLGAGIVVVVGLLLGFGVKGKQKLVALVTNCSVLLVVLFVLVVGLFHLNFQLWSTPEDFFPTSYQGIIEGAAFSIYALSSYEIICGRSDFSRQTSGRTALTAYTMSGFLAVSVFTAITGTTTLLVPINLLYTETPTAEAFTLAGVGWIKFIICIPTLMAMLVFLWMTLCRVHDQLEAVSLDALLCSHFSNPNSRGVCVVSVAVATTLVTLLTLMFSLTNLVQLGSLACLVVATTTCTAAACIRFRPSILVHSPEHTTHKDRQERRKQRKRQQGLPVADVDGTSRGGSGYGSVNNNADDCPMLLIDSDDEEENFVGTNGTLSNGGAMSFTHQLHRNTHQHYEDSDTDIDDVVEEYKEQLRVSALTSCSAFINSNNCDAPTDKSARRAAWSLTLFVCSVFAAFLTLARGATQLRAGNVVLIIALVVFILLLLLCLLVLLQQPQDPLSDMDLRVVFPLSPWVPLLAIVLNLHLSVHLSAIAWVQALVAFLIGSLCYLAYGMRNSRASHFYEFLPEEETVLLPEPPRHLVEPRTLTSSSSTPACSLQTCDHQLASSEPDVPLMD